MEEVKRRIAGNPKKILADIGRAIKGIILKIYSKIPNKKSKYYDGDIHQRRYLLKLAVSSAIIYMYIEEFARIRESLIGVPLMIIHQPLVFLYNWLIIFTTMAVALLFRRRSFAVTLVGFLWVLVGTINGVILLKRMTPFTLYDLQNFKDGMSIATEYFPVWLLIAMFTPIVLTVVFLVIFFFRGTKWQNIRWKKSAFTFAVLVGVTFASTFGLLKIGILSTYFGNLNYAYNDYGFPYGFINTTTNVGIRKPLSYSKKTIDKILNTETENGRYKAPDPEEVNSLYTKNGVKPNIIVLQLESFTRAQDYSNIKVSKDPTPVFNALTKEYSTGWFRVPACGGGTANTEFEVLTGISARFFGPGEYPYKGKLRKQTQESMAYVLKDNGYYTAALHNHRAVFYNRNEVYPNLGFDSFTSVEYMSDVQRTPSGWTKDKVMTDDIMDMMKPDRPAFLHIVSVQGHGAYPEQQVFVNPYTKVTADDEKKAYQYEYYFNECYEMDQFLGDLIKGIEDAKEPTIMLVYGDHIPALDVKPDEYGGSVDLYNTRYVIWDNIGLKKKDGNLNSYEAGARLLREAGLAHRGTIFDFQQSADRSDRNKYLRDLKALAYDQMYGRRYSYAGKSPFRKVKMKMGYRDIRADKIVKIGDSYFIKGRNFTECSSFSLKGKALKTIYLSPTLIGLQQKVDPQDVHKLKVSQIDRKDDSILTTTNTLEEL